MEINDIKELHVAVLAGGSSGEREISIQSGVAAKNALKEAGYDVEMIDPANKSDLADLVSGKYDVAMLCLHGKGGEDGTIQGFLETVGIPYTGSGVLSSALAIDKDKAKVIYRNNELPTPFSVTLRRDGFDVHSDLAKVQYPCVVKPATEGSALGVFIVEDKTGIVEAIEKVFKIDEQLLIESYVRGIEVTAAVLGNDNPQALPVIEIVHSHEFYDFESKYAPGGSQHICPARLDDEITQLVQSLAVKAHQVLGCKGVSRTDMIIDSDGQPWILETNTIPGMTETSLLPDAARAVGISFPELCSKLVELAVE